MVGRPANGTGGFTMIEILIASVLLAILIVGLAMFFASMLRQSDVLDDRTRALELAKGGLEEMRTVDFDTVPSPDAVYGPETIEKFDRWVYVSTPVDTLQKARLVRCCVRFESANGSDSVSLSTIF